MTRNRTTCVLMLAMVLGFPVSHVVCSAAEPKPIWLAVTEPELSAPLKPLAEKRRSEGFEVVVSNQRVEAALAALPRRPAFLLLAGRGDSGRKDPRVPAKMLKLYRWRNAQPAQFLSDMAWGDLDGDGIPDVPVGRIPAGTPGQLELVVRKILAYESQPPSSADLQSAIWLGSPGYNATIDAAASAFCLMTLQSDGPSWLQPWLISANGDDPYCGWPPDQPDRFTEQLKRGGTASILMGHANRQAFFSMRFASGAIWYRAGDAASTLGKGLPTPPMFFFSCESGRFGQATPCEAEEFLLMPGGPVATIAATTESHPLPNYFSGVCLLKAFGRRERRLGALWLNAQREALRSRNILIESMLRDVEGKLDPQIDEGKLRRDQMLMYTIFGDPATRLRVPERLNASIERTATGWRWKATKPAGVVHIEVGFRPPRPPLASWNGPRKGEREAARSFDAANAGFAFVPLRSPPDNGVWEGEVERRGWIRLVASDKIHLYVAVLKAEK